MLALLCKMIKEESSEEYGFNPNAFFTEETTETEKVEENNNNEEPNVENNSTNEDSAESDFSWDKGLEYLKEEKQQEGPKRPMARFGPQTFGRQWAQEAPKWAQPSGALGLQKGYKTLLIFKVFGFDASQGGTKQQYQEEVQQEGPGALRADRCHPGRGARSLQEAPKWRPSWRPGAARRFQNPMDFQDFRF